MKEKCDGRKGGEEETYGRGSGKGEEEGKERRTRKGEEENVRKEWEGEVGSAKEETKEEGMRKEE